jgi:hypothetical protein
VRSYKFAIEETHAFIFLSKPMHLLHQRLDDWLVNALVIHSSFTQVDIEWFNFVGCDRVLSK